MKINVIGSGIWGACTAYFLQKEGADVELYDMWGPGNARSGSGGASRIIRLSYGNDKIYTELTNKSFKFWENLSNKSERELYNENGMLWMVSQSDSSYITNSAKHIESCGHSLEEISIDKIKKIYPNINFEDINQVFFEKKAGALMASRCCKNVVREYQNNGGKINIGEVKINEEDLDKNNSITYNGKSLNADCFVIACGPWNRKILPKFFFTTRLLLHISLLQKTFNEFLIISIIKQLYCNKERKHTQRNMNMWYFTGHTCNLPETQEKNHRYHIKCVCIMFKRLAQNNLF